MPGLFDPIVIHGLELKNRIVMAPMATSMATPEGHITERHIKHYTARAEGGAGLIIIEHTFVSPEGQLSKNQTGLYEDSQVAKLKTLVDAIHHAGAKVIIQLTHAGVRSSSEVTGNQPAGPSKVMLPDATEEPKALSINEIKSITTAFKDSARRAIEAGCDGVELHGAHGFLLGQFMSPAANIRTDEYGGSLENRIRFALEVIKETIPALEGTPLFYRFGADDMIDEGLTQADGQEIAPYLEKAGVDVLDISGGIGVGNIIESTEPGFLVPLAKAIKKVVTIPVIGVGNINEPEFADSLIRDERIDLAAIGRKLLSDPNFPNEAAKTLGISI